MIAAPTVDEATKDAQIAAGEHRHKAFHGNTEDAAVLQRESTNIYDLSEAAIEPDRYAEHLLAGAEEVCRRDNIEYTHNRSDGWLKIRFYDTTES